LVSKESRTSRLWKRQFKIDIDVMARLSEAFSRKERLKKTHLHYASRTSWASLDRYLNWLQTNNMVKCTADGKKKEYQLTEHGKQMCNLVIKLKEHIKSTKLIFAILMPILSDNLDALADIVT